jgi:hypothetical protein
MQNSVLKEMKDEFDTWQLGTDRFFETQTVLNKMQDLHEQVLQQLGTQILSGLRGGVTVGGGGGLQLTMKKHLVWHGEKTKMKTCCQNSINSQGKSTMCTGTATPYPKFQKALYCLT